MDQTIPVMRFISKNKFKWIQSVRLFLQTYRKHEDCLVFRDKSHDGYSLVHYLKFFIRDDILEIIDYYLIVINKLKVYMGNEETQFNLLGILP